MMKKMLQKCFTMGGILLELISEQFNVHAFQSSLCCAAQCSRLTGKDTKSQRLKSWKWGLTGWLGFCLNLKAMRLEIYHLGFKGHHLQLAIFSYVSTQGHIGYICNKHTCMCSPVLKSTWHSGGEQCLGETKYIIGDSYTVGKVWATTLGITWRTNWPLGAFLENAEIAFFTPKN